MFARDIGPRRGFYRLTHECIVGRKEYFRSKYTKTLHSQRIAVNGVRLLSSQIGLLVVSANEIYSSDAVAGNC